MSKLVGDDNWNAQKLEIVQYGSHSWRGKVIVWRVTSGSHGRKLDGDANGDWKKDDTIMLQTCSKEGKFLIIRIFLRLLPEIAEKSNQYS